MNIFGPDCHAHGIKGYGNPDSGVMIVGIAPGRNEARQGKPFVGESGRLLDALLKAVGWSRDDVYCTNLICTWHDEPTPEELQACRPRLIQEIQQYQPHLIITLGKIATEEFFRTVYPKKTFGQLQGSVLWTTDVLGSRQDCYVLSTFHPAAILRMSLYVHSVYRDLSKIKRVMEWGAGSPPAQGGDEYVLCPNQYEAQLALDAFATLNRPYVAVDIETSIGKDAEDESLDVFNDRLLCVGVSDGYNTFVIPEPYAHDLDWHIGSINYTFHNGNFDVQGLARFLSIHLPIVHDTMLMSYNLDERSGVHRLKFLAREYLGAGFYEEDTQVGRKKGAGLETLPPEQLYKYNAMDAAFTARLAPILYDKMQADNVLWPYHNLMIPAANVFADVQYRGVKVDMTRLNDLELKWYPRWIETDKAIQEYGELLGAPKPFNPRSDKQLKHLIFDILGLVSPSDKRTGTGAKCLDKTVREEMQGAHPFLDALDDYNKLDHIISNYMLVVRNHIKLDGCLHATTKQHGTVTARTSYTNPPLQTIPNPKYDRNAEFAEFREIFVPHNPETHCIMEIDFSRAEMWWAVTYSGDPNMRADLETGDPHSNTAAVVLDKLLSQVTKQDRTDMKHVTFGKMYGRGDKALAAGELKHWPFAKVVAFSARWNQRYKVYMKWNAEQRNIAMTKGELVSLTGRKRRFKLILEEDYKMLNEAVNFPIQNGATDTTLIAMIKLHPVLRLLDSHVLIMIHDSLVLEVSRAHIQEVAALVRRTMEQVHFPGMLPVPVEIAVGDNWGNTKEIDLENIQSVGLAV